MPRKPEGSLRPIGRPLITSNNIKIEPPIGREVRCRMRPGVAFQEPVTNWSLGGSDGPGPGLSTARPNTANGVSCSSFEQLGDGRI